MSVQTMRELSQIQSDLDEVRETLRLLKLESSTIPDALKAAERSLDLITFDELRKRESHLPMLIAATERHITLLEIESREARWPAYEWEAKAAHIEADAAIAAMPAAEQALHDAKVHRGNAIGRLNLATMRLQGLGQEISELKRKL